MTGCTFKKFLQVAVQVCKDNNVEIKFDMTANGVDIDYTTTIYGGTEFNWPELIKAQVEADELTGTMLVHPAKFKNLADADVSLLIKRGLTSDYVNWSDLDETSLADVLIDVFVVNPGRTTSLTVLVADENSPTIDQMMSGLIEREARSFIWCLAGYTALETWNKWFGSDADVEEE